jgi:chromosome segregation ATPase
MFRGVLLCVFQVTQVFEQLATTVASSSQDNIAELKGQLQQVRGMLQVLATSKADVASLEQHQSVTAEEVFTLQQELQQLRVTLSEVATATRQAPQAVEAVRMELAEVQGNVEALRLTTAGELLISGGLRPREQQEG